MSGSATVRDAAADGRALVALLSVIFVNIAGFGVVMPLLPFYGKAFGAPAWQITLLFSAYSVGQFLGEPFWGRLSDRIGRRPVLMATIAASGLAYLALAFAPNIVAAVAARLAGGFLAGNISTLQGAIADVTPPQQRAGRMGLMAAVFSLGFVMGPGLGGLLARPELGSLGFQLPLFVAGGLGLASALGVLLLVPETLSAANRGRPRAGRASLREAFANPVTARTLLIGLVVSSGFSGLEAVYGLWAQSRFEWGPRQIGFAFMAVSLLASIAQGFLTGRLARRFGEPSVVMAGLVLMGTGIIVQVTAPVWPLAVAGLCVMAFGQSACFPTLTALISRAAPPERQGEMMGLNMSFNALGRIGGPIYAGQLFSLVSRDAPFLLMAAVVLPALALAWQVRRRMRAPA
jgi:MFS family permease